jgi:L-ascorbate metabolism protein UlaG (beta-lactamase superfamily)
MRFGMKAKVLLAACMALASLSLSARAAEPEACPRLIAEGPPRFLRAAATQEMARLTFAGHATFLIETQQGVRAATDYSDYVHVPMPLAAVTMNKAHTSHFTSHPDPRIEQVLRGWNPSGGEMLHDVRIGDLRIRNVQTNIRDWAGGTDYLGNSIFVFETGQMCIAHLGHLHHELTAEHLRRLGQIDVLLVPVDGSYTLDQSGMMDVIEKIGPRVVVPMHFFGSSTLERFLRLAGERFEVERREKPELVVVKDQLPVKTRVVVLPGH